MKTFPTLSPGCLGLIAILTATPPLGRALQPVLLDQAEPAEATSLPLSQVYSGDKAITLTGPKGANVHILVISALDAKDHPDKAKSCQAAITSSTSATERPPLSNAGENKISLGEPVAEGDVVCASLWDPKNPVTPTLYSEPAPVTKFTPTPTTKPEIYVTPTPGHALTVKSYLGKNSTIYVYVEPAAKVPSSQLSGADCATLAKDTSLFALSQSFPAEEKQPQTFKLQSALQAGDTVCVTNYDRTTPSANFSLSAVVMTPQTVAAPVQEPNFAHSFYTFGAVISNQLSSSNSTTAAQYVDLGFSFKFKTESASHAPGFNTSFSGRFTSMPVAAGAATPAAANASSSLRDIATSKRINAAASTVDTTAPLNVLSSQESARVMSTAFVPFRIGDTSSDDDALYFGPIAKASFSTLINPSQTVAPASGTVLVAPQFATTYNDWSIGGRIGWRRYPDKKIDKGSVQTLWQLDATFGKFSNLQDIFCNHSKATTTTGVTPAPANTSCFDTPVTTTATDGTKTTTYTTYRPDRLSNPRLELDGFARIVGTPFVVGIDANLSQYAIANHFTDTLNRAGSDVRIYFGITGTISDLFNQLHIGPSSQAAAK